MSFDLLKQAQELFSEETVQQIAGQVGAPEASISKALSGAIPGLLGGLINKAESHGGALAIAQLTAEAESNFGGMNLSSLLQNPEMLTSGWETVKNLFGSNSDNFLGKLASFSGAKVSTITTILGLAGPTLFKFLGKYATEHKLSPEGLVSVLSSNKSEVMKAIPTDFNLASVFSTVSNNTTVAANPSLLVPPPLEKKENNWLWPVLILLGIAGLIWWWFNKETKVAEVETVATETKVAPTYVDPSVLGTFDSIAGNFVYNVGNLADIKLPDGTNINVGDNSSEARLFRFLNDGAIQVDTVDKTKGWISLDRVYFETGKNSLTATSNQQLTNLAAILKAFPGATVKFGGYTDDTGDEAANVELSEARAAAAMNSLKNMNIDSTRLASEGYGSMHPLASNETAEGRALNRRVDVRVTKK